MRGRAVLLIERLCNGLGFCIGCAVGVFRPEMHLKCADSFPGVFIQDAAERDPVVAVPPERALEGKDIRHLSWDGYIEVGGNRYSMPESLCDHPVSIRISLDDGAGAPCSAVATGQSG
ncbi:hypothetical protein NB704_004305 [Pantoea ananatis]|nr:hypothetical protein [Pantoea ananatis]